MAQTKGLVKLLRMKIGLIKSQKDELHGVLDKYVAKMTDEAKEAVEIEGHDVNTLKEINSTMDTVLEYLLNITSQMDDGTSTQIAPATGLSSTPPSSSSSMQESPSDSRQRRSRDLETEEMTKLQHRIEVLESAFTACRHEMGQTDTKMTEAKDELDTRCLRLEEKVQLLTNENQETEKKQAVKFEAMDKKIEDCQRQSLENDQRLQANLENNALKLDDVVKKVEEISAQVDRHETEEMTKFHRRTEVLESAFTACRNEISQTEKKHAVKFEAMDKKIGDCQRQSQAMDKKIEDCQRQSQAMDKKIEDCQRQSQDMDKKIEDCQRQSQENDQRLANLETHTQKLDDVTKKVEEISTQVNRHERSLVPVRVGFTAYHRQGPVPNVGSRITDFTDVLCNEGNHYSPSTGEFICPIDGLYLVSATLWQLADGYVNTRIKRQSANSATPATEVCRVYTEQARNSSCGVGVVRLQVGDRVYVELVGTLGTPRLLNFSSFSCVLIT